MSQRVTVVGDDYQAIYGFRGAQPDVFQKFIDVYDHPELQQPLQDNYRYGDIPAGWLRAALPGLLQTDAQPRQGQVCELQELLVPVCSADFLICQRAHLFVSAHSSLMMD